MSRAPIRVLSVIHYASFGGPHNQVLRLAGPLEKRGFETTALLPAEPGNAAERLRSAGIDVVTVPLGRIRAQLDWRTQWDSARLMMGDVPRLSKVIDSRHIDLVVVHGLANPQGAIAARLRGRPVVWQLLDTRLPRSVRTAFVPLVRLLSSSVMTTGQLVADAHPRLPKNTSLFTFFPPVDTTTFRPDDAERRLVRAKLGFEPRQIVVGCVANLTPQKGLDVFVDIAEDIAPLEPDVRFALFGSRMPTQDAYARHLLDRTAELERHGRLVVVDVGAQVAEHMRALDIFVATAAPRSEGISTTLLESMASGVPVVSTDVGAIRESIVEGSTGYVVRSGDRQALTSRVLQLVRDHDRRRQMAIAAREHAEREFGVETCADVHEHAFRAALEAR